MPNELYDSIRQNNQELFKQIEEIQKLFHACFGMPLDSSFLTYERKPKKKMKDKDFLKPAVRILNDMARDLQFFRDYLKENKDQDDEDFRTYVHERIVNTCDTGLEVLGDMLEELKESDE